MDCPPWIDPGNAFRFLIKCGSYKANLEYGMLDMQEQEHEHWIDSTRGYSMQDFIDDMATKIIWGSSQELQVWGVDTESGSEWRVRDNDQFQRMIQCRLDVRFMKLAVDVIEKGAYKKPVSTTCTTSSSHAVSMVTGTVGDSGDCIGTVGLNVDDEQTHFGGPVDWDSLVVVQDETNDGERNALVDEAAVYEAMGFAAFDNEAAKQADQEYSIPCMSADMDNDIRQAAIPVDDNEVNEHVVDWDRDNPEMVVGATYPCMTDFRQALKHWAIIHEFRLGTEKSDRDRFRGFCKSNGCPWKITAKTQGDSSVRVQKIKGDHSCASAIRGEGTMASQAWVAERCIPLLKEKKNMGAKEVKERLHSKYRIDIPYQTVWYGRQRAADLLFGKWDDSYDWLYRFKAEVELRSPGSVVEIGTETVDGKKHFSKFFCCFKACIDGFIEGCRPYISIDSTALNGMWNGHMPSASAIDGHNWLFPVAFGLFDSETKENWTWFMEQLGRALGPLPHLAICTDACKGLIEAVKKVFPGAEHRECFRHLMENMKKNFTGTEYAKYMWPAARAYTPEKHKYLLDKVLQNTPGLQAWLEKDHSLLWTRSKFSEQIKCDYINNNLVESWNGWIKELKDLPPDAMADAIREKMVVLFEKRRKISMGLSGCILPAVVHQLNAASKGLTHLRVTKGNSEQAQVTEIYKDEAVRRHVVYLKDHHCTCRQWQISGKPCPHALALITTERQPNMEPFVDIAYSVQKFQAAYAGCIPNITDKDQWPHVDKGFKLLPPIAKPRGLGRQRKNRLLGPLERSGKATRQSKCHGCGELGHRKGSWRCSLTGTKKRKRKPKKAGVKPGRKKSKQAEETEETVVATETEETVAATETEETVVAQQTEQAADVVPALPQFNTPRTRAAAAREAVMAAAAQAEHTPVTRRRLALEYQSAIEARDETEEPKKQQPAKKMTPKKRVCTKVKKTTAKPGQK